MRSLITLSIALMAPQLFAQDVNFIYNDRSFFVPSPIDAAVAEGIRIENNKRRIFNRWQIRDTYHNRRASKLTPYWKRVENRLDMAEKMYALKQRERELRIKGVLPHYKPEPRFSYNGVTYKNMEEFKNSDGYHDMLFQRQIREEERAIDNLVDEMYRDQIVLDSAKSRYPGLWRQRKFEKQFNLPPAKKLDLMNLGR